MLHVTHCGPFIFVMPVSFPASEILLALMVIQIHYDGCYISPDGELPKWKRLVAVLSA